MPLAATQMIFGMDVVIWSMIIPIVVGWHAAFFVNSAAHVWGYQTYETGDLSTNNWWVALLAGGELRVCVWTGGRDVRGGAQGAAYTASGIRVCECVERQDGYPRLTLAMAFNICSTKEASLLQL